MGMGRDGPDTRHPREQHTWESRPRGTSRALPLPPAKRHVTTRSHFTESGPVNTCQAWEQTLHCCDKKKEEIKALSHSLFFRFWRNSQS